MKPRIEISEIIERELASWPDVTIGPHRFGGREFRVGKREIGHVHGSQVADLPFPRAIRDELISSGNASPHHHLPDSGWISFLSTRPRLANFNAPALTQRPPRSPRSRLGGYSLLPRLLDKGRATLAGRNGEYHFDCPLE